MKHVSFPKVLATARCILGEGAVIERLRRNSELELDPEIVNSAFIYDKRTRDALAEIYRQYLDIGCRYNLPLLLSTPTWRASRERIKNAGFETKNVNADNFRFFDKQVDVEIKRTRRTGSSFSLMMLDVDNFKLLNDTLGHQEGNAFLIGVADIFAQNLRPTDIGCRFGGDEFAVLMPATSYIDAMLVARRLREAVLSSTRKYNLPVSFSIGIAEYKAYSGESRTELIESADRSLYAAKKSGKNRIFCEEQPETAPAPDAVTGAERGALLTGGRNDDVDKG